ncbi:hypothetical protein SmJEL517_g02386 [Synchytrium microbalum]|uniref:RAD50-interacting protein 1 n=1 Tax=Synchytrium microbalum TaxID=1806994 RepID=A0A507C7L9_9FUNG|nr:uncharacterized protein SmJEL517_g02386 [Synchytrium microbalum]TPX35139.1 hypothetical protein SmJEL517_g02386 [Synchytrium microbalum]
MIATTLTQLLPDQASLDNIHALVDHALRSHLQIQARLQERNATTPRRVKALSEAALNLKSTLSAIKTEIRDLRALINQLLSSGTHETIRFVKESRRVADQLRNVCNYLATVSKFVNLKNLVANDIPTLSTYTELLALRDGIPVSSNRLRLTDHIGSVALDQRLVGLGWPTQMETTNLEAMRPFRDTFHELVILESLDGIETATASSPRHLAEPPTAIKCLVKPILLRFQYHFSGDRPTNRRDKPEWMFKFIQKSISDHAMLLAQHIQPLFHDSPFSTLDAKNEFIQCLVIAMIDKLVSEASIRTKDPSLLSPCIKAAIDFDRTLLNTFDYQPRWTGTGSNSWKGCASVFLDDVDVFGAWLQYERERAHKALIGIVSSPTAWDFEQGVEDQDIMPTSSSVQFMNLFDTVTDVYAQLPSLSHRLTFFTSLTLDVLEDYLSSCRDVAENVYRKLPSVSNIDKRQATISTRIETLCKCVSSLDFVCEMLRDRAESDFFLDLWDHIVTAKGESPARASGKATSLASTAFDDVMRAYDGCISRISEVIQDVAFQEFVESVWMYEKKKTWAENLPLATTPSPELLPSLSIVKSHLDIIRAHLPSRVFKKHVLIPLAARIDDHLFQRVVMKNRFSKMGASAFAVDMWQGVIRSKTWDVVAGGGDIDKGVRRVEKLFGRIVDAAHLLNLPATTSTGSLSMTTVVQALGSVKNPVLEDRDALKVYKLAAREVIEVLARRIDFG